MVSDLNYLIDVIIASDGYINWTARDTSTAKKMLQRYEAKDVADSQAALERFVQSLEPGTRIDFTFSPLTAEEKSKGGVLSRNDYNVRFIKRDNYGSQVGSIAQPQQTNREDLLTERFMMELNYRDKIRNLEDQIKELKTAQAPSYTEALLGKIVNDPHGLDKIFALGAHLVNTIKGRPSQQPLSQVAGHQPEPTHTDTETTETDQLEQRVQNALQGLAEVEPQIVEVLEGLNRYLHTEQGMDTYKMIKPMIMNA